MNFSIRRVNAIFQKDFKDILRNSVVSVTMLMPITMAFFIANASNDVSIELHYMIINLTLVTVGSFVQCCLIAEEREKNTLRGLMLSPASTLEILSGKSLLSFLATMILIVASAFLTGYQPEKIALIAIAIVFSSLFFIGMGTLLGLFAKSVMEASVIILPFMFIFGFGSMFTMFTDKYPILKVFDYTPNVQLVEIAVKVESGTGISGLWSNFGIITLWIIAVYTLSAFVFKKRKMD